MEEEIVKWRKKDPESVKHSMAKPGKWRLSEEQMRRVSDDTVEILINAHPQFGLEKWPVSFYNFWKSTRL